MSVVIDIPVALRQYTLDRSKVRVEASTLEEALSELEGLFPGFVSFILDESRAIRRYVNIFVNDSDVRLGFGLMTGLKDGDQVRIVPAVAGG